MKTSVNKVDSKKKKRDVATTRVHAQRKFAQGSSLAGPSSVASKEKAKSLPQTPAAVPEQRRLTDSVPTKDLLDFFCFRRSSLLPKDLYYLRDAFSVSASSSSSVQSSPRPSVS